jgi:DeoR family transcriptional regulator, fructose operon transcriptional repressor
VEENMTKTMDPQVRRKMIVAEVRRHGGATSAALAHAFGVSRQTIRHDLQALENAGLLHRVHGGAVTTAVFAVTRARAVHVDTAVGHVRRQGSSGLPAENPQDPAV